MNLVDLFFVLSVSAFLIAIALLIVIGREEWEIYKETLAQRAKLKKAQPIIQVFGTDGAQHEMSASHYLSLIDQPHH